MRHLINAQTLAAFERLEQIDWFSAAGQSREGPFVIVASWQEAVLSCSADNWQDLILEAANRSSEAVANRDKERFSRWNSVVLEVRKVVLPLVETKVHLVCAAQGLPKVVEDCVRWDLIHFGLECEFADIFPPGSFAGQIYWYINGRFPSGWSGEFPDGKLVLY